MFGCKFTCSFDFIFDYLYSKLITKKCTFSIWNQIILFFFYRVSWYLQFSASLMERYGDWFYSFYHFVFVIHFFPLKKRKNYKSPRNKYFKFHLCQKKRSVEALWIYAILLPKSSGQIRVEVRANSDSL